MPYFIVILIIAVICFGFPTVLNICTALASGFLILLGIKCFRASKKIDDSLAKIGSVMFMIFGVFVVIIRFTLF
ncbi:hypothetical protein D3C72_1565910 [compost metagenome]